MNLVFQSAGLSDSGRVRTKNEDRWVADPSLGLYMVIDGMGGHPAGALAADIIAQTFPRQIVERLANVDAPLDDATVQQVQTLLSSLSKALADETRGEFGLEGLGATVVVLLVRGHQGLVAHLGDSRAYLLRDSQLTRLTKDHTIVQLLLDRGEILPEEAADHPARHQITRFVGLEDTPLPDVHRFDLRADDRILLCSDGLSGMVEDTQLRLLLAAANDPTEVCQQLIRAANEAGGKDNVTAVVVHVDDDSIPGEATS